MGHNCGGQPRTAGELVKALQAVDPTLPVRESWDEGAGWFEVSDGVLWLGVHGPCDSEHVAEEDRITLEQVERDIVAGAGDAIDAVNVIRDRLSQRISDVAHIDPVRYWITEFIAAINEAVRYWITEFIAAINEAGLLRAP